MSDLITLATWQESVGPRYMYGVDDVHNLGTLHSYTYNRMDGAGQKEKQFRHGNRLKDRISFAAQTRMRRIDPLDEDANYTRVNPGLDTSAPYSIAYVPIVLNRFAMELSASQMKPEALAHIFKSYWKQIWTDVWTGTMNDLDAECWAVPDKLQMEVTTATSKMPFSFPVWFNEFLNGLPAASDQPGGTWTTKQQLAPTNAGTVVGGRSRWDVQRLSYDLNSMTTADIKKEKYSNFLSQLQSLYRFCRFDVLPHKPTFSDPRKTPRVIFCSNTGLAHVDRAQRFADNHVRGSGLREDLNYPTPLLYNMPFEWISALDTAAIYPTAASDALGVETSTANTPATATNCSDGTTPNIGAAGPRYYMANLASIYWAWHAEHYIKEENSWETDRAKPWEISKVVTIMNQLWCDAPCHNGFLFPSVDADAIS